jgi:hypothetical protein
MMIRNQTGIALGEACDQVVGLCKLPAGILLDFTAAPNSMSLSLKQFGLCGFSQAIRSNILKAPEIKKGFDKAHRTPFKVAFNAHHQTVP